MNDRMVLVTGAGGFIGGHLIRALIDQGRTRIRAVDIKPIADWCQVFPGVDNRSVDLRGMSACAEVAAGAAEVYNLACNMGGMGFIEAHKAECMMSVLINTQLLMAARHSGAERYFFSSTACVYAAGKQDRPDVAPLKEDDVYPAMPEDGYGWEKLFGERMCRHFHEDFGVETRIGRYHNTYGPHGTYSGGREKAPAAICRKVIAAQLSGSNDIEVWGDGLQTRSFMYVDDCIEGTLRLMASEVREPLNIGSDEPVSINQLIDVVEEIAGQRFRRHYDLSAPTGVRGRSSDNTRIRKTLGWSPSTRLRDGIETTYRWIYQQMMLHGRHSGR